MNAIARKADIVAALGETAELLGTDKDGSAFVLLRLKPRVLDALLAMPGLVEDLEDDDPAGGNIEDDGEDFEDGLEHDFRHDFECPMNGGVPDGIGFISRAWSDYAPSACGV